MFLLFFPVALSPTTPVLVVGPSGVGKQYAAEELHRLTHADGDQDAPFVEINCAALPENLVESELFGHEKGAFTDAKTSRRGLIEMADGGTLFLDEVTELPPHSQAKLLKFMDSMRFRRLGGQREITVSLRIVAASNREIREEVRSGRMREDLFHRLAVFEVNIPALRERREDLSDLAESFVRFFSARIKKRLTGLTPAARQALLAYDYPGQVRELRNIIERAVILARGTEITEREVVLPGHAASEPPSAGFFSIGLRDDGTVPPLDVVEREYLTRVLSHLEGRRVAAAQALGISYPTFLKRLRELSLESGGDE